MSDDIDFSDAGLGITDAPEPEVAADTSNPDVSAEEVADTPDTPVDEAPDSADNPVSEGEPEPWETRYSEAQKLIGRQGQELGELRKAVEAMQAAAQEQYAAEPEPVFGFQTAVPTTHQELLEFASDGEKAVDAYNFAAQNAPDLVPEVIAEVRYHDPVLAERMQLDYVQSMMHANMNPVQQQYQQTQANEQLVTTVDGFAKSVEGFDDIKGEVAAIIEEEPDLMGDGSPEQVLRGLKWATKMAQQARHHAATHAAAQQKAQGLAMRQEGVVETGTRSAAPVPTDSTPEDAIRDAIFADDERRRRAMQ